MDASPVFPRTVALGYHINNLNAIKAYNGLLPLSYCEEWTRIVIVLDGGYNGEESVRIVCKDELQSLSKPAVQSLFGNGEDDFPCLDARIKMKSWAVVRTSQHPLVGHVRRFRILAVCASSKY